ncbi:MAG: hypothetical protein HZC42_15050 [Candidatus Eisenbacteria bacterium]|nr:hypothetical protein [Candidatus Eisenbacteria bacterium]
MAFNIRRVDYFYATVEDEPGEAYELLTQLAGQGVNLLALTAVPVGPLRTQLTLFPEDRGKLVEAARHAGLALGGPHKALLVQGDDELGALAGIHAKLHRADVEVYASTCVTDGRGSYGYILYVRPEHFERAAKALEI